MTPADEEREKAYTLAESLNSQLDDMSSQLSTLIQDMNVLSSQQDNDDPMNLIVRILGEHLTSLEWINQSVHHLGDKVKDLQQHAEVAQSEADRLHKSEKSLF